MGVISFIWRHLVNWGASCDRRVYVGLMGSLGYVLEVVGLNHVHLSAPSGLSAVACLSGVRPGCCWVHPGGWVH